ncbi:unnamed protein product [Pseudo-nitzschia multistriata]|uniref:TAZ-type domain-containing protein n=1 Tax=Pseudo-nitzschia multistriata TaxID=183589 RepID=A0A448ZEC8_9STRA|nr:unnamed protein product [Pseudo-nitzschia multistriata]
MQSTPSTTTTSKPSTGENNEHQSQTQPLDAAAACMSSTRTNVVMEPSVEPANKRIKLEDGVATEVPIGTATPLAGNTSEQSADIQTNDRTPILTTTSISISSSIQKPSLPLGSTTKPAVVKSESMHGNQDTSTTTGAATIDPGSTTKPRHAPTPKPAAAAQPQQQPQEIKPPVMGSVCPSATTQLPKNIPVKDEASSSNNSQGGTTSVVTASDESLPQNTSNSDNRSSNSSHESLQESTATAVTNSTSATSTTTRPPNASNGATLPASAATIRPVAPIPPPTQLSNRATTALKDPPSSTTIPPAASKPTPVRTQVAPSQTTTATLASHTIAGVPNSREVPLKSLNFRHLRIKYLGELEYMLREFRKLERQLLGAKGAQQLEESQGSRERREKLHSFILHLEDTIRQIELGCKLEGEGKSATTENRNVAAGSIGGAVNASNTANDGSALANATLDKAAREAKKQMAEESALSNLTKEKEEEETVQKLEEHILANLLPVKVRLKKQLAAQQGATQNPPGMPARRGSMQPSSAARGKGTFVEAVEKKRKHAESLRLAAQAQHERQVRSVTDPTQFGKPLSGVGSSLTKKLHGSTLGSKQRRTGHGVGSISAPQDRSERKILHAGMVPKSSQQESGLSAASGVHEIVTSQSQKNNPKTINKSIPTSAIPAAAMADKAKPAQTFQAEAKNTTLAAKPKPAIDPKAEPATTAVSGASTSDTVKKSRPLDHSTTAPMSEEDKLKFKKHRRLRKLKRLKRRRERELARQQQSKTQQQIPNSSQSAASPNAVRKKPGHCKPGQKKKGPRVVEYLCSQCSEAYSSTCEFNPWWALAQHKCPKCGKTQIPRIDISSPANTIEYHPALLSHLEDGGRGNAGSIPSNGVRAVVPAMPIVSQIPDGASDVNSESDSDLSELSDDNISIGSLKAAELESDLRSMTPAERAEHETFGSEYKGPVLSDEHASKLLILMGHAATCPCQHKLEKHRDVCRSVKYMMLHVRDCPGTTSTFDVCPFPWCRKVKHLLYHLVSCKEPDQCAICSPKELPKGLKGLVGLNGHRMKKHRERMIAAAKASLAKNTKSNAASKKQTATKKAASPMQVNNVRKSDVVAKMPVADQNPATQKPALGLAPAAALVVSKTEPVGNHAQFVSRTAKASSIGTGSSNEEQIQKAVATVPHPAFKVGVQPGAQPGAQRIVTEEGENLDVLDNIYEDMAKIDVEAAEEVDCGFLVADAVPTENTSGADPDFATALEPSMALPESIHPTPVVAIKMEGDYLGHGPDPGLGDLDLLGMDQDDVFAIRDDGMNKGGPAQHPLNDPNPDPLASINHEIIIDPSDIPPSVMVPPATDTTACCGPKQEYSQATNSTSVPPASGVPTATAATTIT